jgi:glyoxylase-like metal-dependent hydrolase (beta-lactamase superfamily II)/rhodanese-related sulfurtransferase
MHFRQFYLGCLAHASYLIASEGEAAVVDPQRDVDQYLVESERIGARIRYVLETHLHADFVSGHQELAARAGAEIVFGARAGAEYRYLAARDGDELRVGSVRIRAIETPGHTPESLCWLVWDTAHPEEPQKLLTGDTLFIGDVGRPDLVGSKGYAPAQMAGMLYDSLHGRILRLPDAVEVWPAHGAGSACGRNISSERFSTIGAERARNYALRPMSRDDFVALMTADLAEPPPYFAHDAELNRRGVVPPARADAPLTAREVGEHASSGATLLDVRDAASFGCGHVPGSLNVGLDGQFASWCGRLLSFERPILLVADSRSHLAEARLRLARVGLENVAGHLEGGVAAWSAAGREVATLRQTDVVELRARLEAAAAPVLLDVREPAEFDAGHVPSARNVPLGVLERRMGELDRTAPAAVICAGGYRSSAAASMLLRSGLRDVWNVIGGTSAWRRAGFPEA